MGEEEVVEVAGGEEDEDEVEGESEDENDVGCGVFEAEEEARVAPPSPLVVTPDAALDSAGGWDVVADAASVELESSTALERIPVTSVVVGWLVGSVSS